MTPEGQVKKDCRAYLKSVPGLWFTTTQNMGYGKSGVPDDLVCYRGRFLALEYKPNAATPAKPWQAREIREIVEAGGIAEVVWMVEQVKAIVERIDATLTTDDVMDTLSRTRGQTVKQMPDGTYQRVPLKF